MQVFTFIELPAKTGDTPTNIQRAAFFPYKSTVAIYHCPSDQSEVTGKPILRFRSYAMSYPWMNGDPGFEQINRREADIHEPNPTLSSRPAVRGICSAPAGLG